MKTLIAIGHLCGALLASGLFYYFVILRIHYWDLDRFMKRCKEEAAVYLGVAVYDLENEENSHKCAKYFIERWNPELFKNRFSDFCNIIAKGLGKLGVIIEVLFLIAAISFTILDGLENAVYAWLLVGIVIIFYIAEMAIVYICLFITGREPGEAKRGRSALAYLINPEN